MTTKEALHALVDGLDGAKLELAAQALYEIRDEAFDLSDAEEQQILQREAECDAGKTVNAQSFLLKIQSDG